MSFNDFMSRVRYWDNHFNKWMIRHFYILFFQIVLVGLFVFFFILTINTIDIGTDLNEKPSEHLMVLQSYNFLMLTFLLFLNSFWMLYIFGEIIRIRSSLKELVFNLTRPQRNK